MFETVKDAALFEVPAGASALKGMLDLNGEVQGVHRPIEKLVDVGRFVGPGEEVVKPPQVNIAIRVAAEALIAVVVAAHRSKLLVAVQQGWNGRLDRGGKVLVEPAAPDELGELMFGERVFGEGLHLAQVTARVVGAQEPQNGLFELLQAAGAHIADIAVAAYAEIRTDHVFEAHKQLEVLDGALAVVEAVEVIGLHAAHYQGQGVAADGFE